MTTRAPSWRTPLTLGALVVLPFLLPRSTDSHALRERLLSGDCEALPVLAQHHPQTLDLELFRTLAAHTDPRLRELVAHQAWIPHINLRTQHEVVGTLQPPALQERARIWLSRRSTSQKALTLTDLETYWASRDS